jgi:hypothetical protein
MVVAPLVIDLGIILTFLVALALCLLAKQLVKALFQVASSAVGWIPWLGSRVTGDLHRIEQRVTNSLGNAADGLSARIGGVYHSAARLVEETGQKIEDAYRLLGGVAGIMELFVPYREVLALYHALAKAIARLHGSTKEQTKAINATTHTVTHVIKRIDTVQVRAQAIPADVVLPGELVPLRAHVRAVEDRLARLWRWAQANKAVVTTDAAVAAVAVALPRLGVNWTRCANWRRIGRAVCGLPGGLVFEIFEAAIVSFAVLDICDFAAAAESVAAAFVPELMALVDVEDALIGCHGATAAPPLALPRLHLPPSNLGLSLAA